MAGAARTLAQNAADDSLHLPYLHPAEDLHHSTLALRRLVDLWRVRRQELEARNAQLGAQLQARTHELSTLQDLSIGLNKHTEMGALVGEALRAPEQTMDYASASIWARHELSPSQPVVLMGYRNQDSELAGTDVDSLAGQRLSRANLQRYEQIEAENQPIVENHPHQSLLGWLWAMVTDDARTSALYRNTRAWRAVPLSVRNGVLGVLRVDHAEPDFFDPQRKRLLVAVGSQTALAMRHANLLERQRHLAVAAGRKRIARDLHDAVSQTLFAANLLAGTLSRDDGLSEAARGQVATLERLNRSALAEMRMMLFELRPDALESVRLPELLQHAVEALAGRGGVAVTTDIAAESAPPPKLRVEVDRIAQEALSNVGRHSGARHVHVGWTLLGSGRGRLHSVDDGCGFDTTAEHPGHFSLAAMLKAEPGMQWVGDAPDGADAVRAAPSLVPDVVLMDLVMPCMDGVAAIAALKPQLPRTKFVILTSLLEPAEVRRAMDAGACGYLLKNAASQELVTVIQMAHKGHRVLAPEVTDALVAIQKERPQVAT